MPLKPYLMPRTIIFTIEIKHVLLKVPESRLIKESLSYKVKEWNMNEDSSDGWMIGWQKIWMGRETELL